MTRNTPKKILFLITKSNWGGAQRYVFDIAVHLDPTVYEPVVALGGDGPLAHELKKQGVRVIHLQNLTRDVSFSKELHAIRELWRIVRAERPDIFHINSSKAGGLGALIGRLARVHAIIFTAHGWAFNEDRPLLSRILIKILHGCTVLLSHKTIAVSETLKQQLNVPFVQKKMTVIHNGRSDISFLSRTDTRNLVVEKVPALAAYKDDFWSVTIGELHPIKQHDVMIRAVAQLVPTHPNLRHIIIGDGEERAALSVLIQNLGLAHHVFLAGSLHEASRLLHAFDLFVLPSRSEALAYVVIEALFAGLPIVASNVGGIPEIITNGKTGILFPQGNVEALQEILAKLMHDETYRTALGNAARAHAPDFSFEKMYTKTRALYDSMSS